MGFEFESLIRIENVNQYNSILKWHGNEIGGFLKDKNFTHNQTNVYFDTDNFDLSKNNISNSIVFNAGRNKDRTKLVLKHAVSNEEGFRRESIKWIPHSDKLDLLLFKDFYIDNNIQININDLKPRVIIRQQRNKKMLHREEKFFYISIDKVDYLHIDNLSIIKSIFLIEIEFNLETLKEEIIIEYKRLMDEIIKTIKLLFNVKVFFNTKNLYGQKLYNKMTWNLRPLQIDQKSFIESVSTIETIENNEEFEQLYLYSKLLLYKNIHSSHHKRIYAYLDSKKQGNEHPSHNTGRVLNNYISNLKFPNISDNRPVFRQEIPSINRTEDREKRKKIFNTLNFTYKNHASKVHSLILKKMNTIDNTKKNSILNHLIPETNKNIALLQKDINIKKKSAKINNFSIFDIKQIHNETKKFPYFDSVKIIKDALGIFGNQYLYAIDDLLNGCIDISSSKTKVNKNLTIFSNVPRHSFISVNYRGDLHSVMVLAHEIGHGVANLMLEKGVDYNIFPGPCAELHGALNEIIVLQYMKNNNIIDSTGYLKEKYRTNFFMNMLLTELEYYIYENKNIETEEISSYYLSLLKKYYGNTITYPHGIEFMWMWNLTRFGDFNFQDYALSFLVSHAIYRKLEESEGTIKKYLTLLKHHYEAPIDQLVRMLDINEDKMFHDFFSDYQSTLIKKGASYAFINK
jgi:oligoendopeptidase F